MTIKPRIFFLWWFSALSGIGAGCAAVTDLITIPVTRPPLLGDATEIRVAWLGFNGDDVALAGYAGASLARRLHADTTMAAIEPVDVARALSGRPYRPGQVSDTLALAVGKSVGADVVVIGQLTRRFTERYGEEKKYRMEEVYRPAGNAMQVRLDPVPYYEPYIDQVAWLSATIRTLDVATGQESRRESAQCAETLHVVLPKPVEHPPEEPMEIERITPALADRAMAKLVDRLTETFAWHTVSLSRQVYRNVQGGKAGLTAILTADWARARGIWEQVVRETPGSATAWNNLAVVYEAGGQMAEAQKAYDRARALAPGNRTILFNSRGKE